jgi:signal peptide peptidase SppA
MNQFSHLAQRCLNVPLAIRPDKAEIILAALAERLGVTRLTRLNGDSVVLAPQAFFDHDDDGPAREPDRFYDLVAGVAVIPVHGTLVQKCGSMRPYSGMTGYNAIRYNFMQALADPDADAIVLDIDSPGGEVAGNFDLTDTIFAARGKKPIWAILDEMACSAAYAIASAADRVTAPRTGYAGSIGVITLHCDLSKALDKEGIAVTLITFGARKADAADTAPLSKEARAIIQGNVDACGELFVATVARNRKLAAAKVRDTEAGYFMGADGVTRGLVDAVMAPDEAFRELVSSLD